MRILYLIIMNIIFLSTTFSQVNKDDWPNLNRYKNDNATVKKFKKNSPRVVFIGNSITEGWDWHYPQFFKNNKNYINRGISGQTTPQMLVRFRQDVVDLDPDIVVILAGINDVAENTGPSTIKSITDNIISMSEIAVANDIKVILSSILPASDFPWRPEISPQYKILKINSILQTYALKNNMVYLDYFSDMFDGNDGLIKQYGADSVHPNKAGYLVMSNLVKKAIAKAFYSTEESNELNLYGKAKWVGSSGEEIGYRYRKPLNLKSNNKYPLLLFLHGSGGRGSENEQQLWDANSIGAFAKQKISSKYQTYIFAPQVPEGERWVSTNWNTANYSMLPISQSMKQTFEALDSFIVKNKNIDTNRIYIMGLSMGGWGVWDAISRRPNYFAAAVPICGGGDPDQAVNLKNVNIWAWHGEDDSVIDVTKSQQMVNAIKNQKGDIKYTEIKKRGHDSWLDVWNHKELWEWLYNQRK
tara:strand:- start:4978 stop:6390 length:1413 start_codon:yes stop_codon:yes gene_type:complete